MVEALLKTSGFQNIDKNQFPLLMKIDRFNGISGFESTNKEPISARNKTTNKLNNTVVPR